MRIKDRAAPKAPPVEPGVYTAVCVYSIDLGDQLREYEGRSRGYQPQLCLGFELVGETMDIDGRTEPRTLRRTFRISSGKNSGLRKFIEAWMGQRFPTDEAFALLNTDELVGLPAQLSIALSEGGEYANIEGIMQLPRGMSLPQPRSPLLRFNIEPWDEDAFRSLPGWAQERIRQSAQYRKRCLPTDLVDFPPPPSPAPSVCEGGCPI